MKCIICMEDVFTSIDNHVRAHLSVSGEEIYGYFTEIVRPYKTALHNITATDVKRGIVYFSMENAMLFIAYAERYHGLTWHECCEWMGLHEKNHLLLRKFYNPPAANPHIVSNVEDYYIEKFMMPQKYRSVYEANAKLIIEIRRMMAPFELYNMSHSIRLYHCLTYACWHALDAISADDVILPQHELKFTLKASSIMKGIEGPDELCEAMDFINKLSVSMLRV